METTCDRVARVGLSYENAGPQCRGRHIADGEKYSGDTLINPEQVSEQRDCAIGGITDWLLGCSSEMTDANADAVCLEALQPWSTVCARWATDVLGCIDAFMGASVAKNPTLYPRMRGVADAMQVNLKAMCLAGGMHMAWAHFVNGRDSPVGEGVMVGGMVGCWLAVALRYYANHLNQRGAAMLAAKNN